MILAAIASWYGFECAHQPMANGKPFHPYGMTAASWFYPLGTKVAVSYRGKTIRVTITDRGPAKRYVRQGRVIDLSLGAFQQLAPTDVGLINVTLNPPPDLNGNHRPK